MSLCENQREMKQTAVDYLLEYFEMEVGNIPFDVKHTAKEMEKEQIVLAHINGQSEFDNGAYRQEVFDNADHYYNSTFNTKER
jgi:hypothetical protein